MLRLPPAYKARAIKLMRLGMARNGDEFIDGADGLLREGGLDVRKLPPTVKAAGKAILGTLAERVKDDDASTGVRAVAKRYGEPKRGN